jgi:hypothetical protein
MKTEDEILDEIRRYERLGEELVADLRMAMAVSSVDKKGKIAARIVDAEASRRALQWVLGTDQGADPEGDDDAVHRSA